MRFLRHPLRALSSTLLLGLAAPSLAQQPTAAPANALPTLDAQRQARAQDRDVDLERAQAANAEIERLRRQLVSMGQAEASGERTVGGARSQLRQLNLDEAELKLRMGHNQESLTKLLGALQMYARNPPPALLVDPRSARDAVRAAILIKAITPDLEARARDFTAQSEALKKIRRRTAVANGALFTAESDVADKRAQIEDLIEQKRALEKQLSTDAGLAEGDMRRLAAKAGSLGQFVSVLDTKHVDAGAEADMPQSFTPPVAGAPERRFGEAGGGAPHAKGWTWATDPSASVVSPASGRVDYAGPLKGWGLVVILRVGDHHVVLAGLASVGADTGSTVTAGEPIGRMADGPGRPELYLEVRRGATPLDPARWLAVNAPPAAPAPPPEPALRGRTG
ncbi:MAG: murein hydrolase activator EnvC family protein [Caulobacteraceae bacterium]